MGADGEHGAADADCDAVAQKTTRSKRIVIWTLGVPNDRSQATNELHDHVRRQSSGQDEMLEACTRGGPLEPSLHNG